MVPLAEFATPVWSETPLQLVRYQGFLASRISGTPAPGTSSGAAMAEMERLAAQLPPGFAVAWTGQSLQERQSAAQAPLLMALSMLVVFLVLAALYESWSIPLSVMLVVPLGLLGAVAAVLLRGMPNDVFFKVGLITIIDRKSTRLNSSHLVISYAVFCLKKKKEPTTTIPTTMPTIATPVRMVTHEFCGLSPPQTGTCGMLIAYSASAAVAPLQTPDTSPE